MGAERYPLPWAMLKYDTNRGGYVVPLEKEQLGSAPRYDAPARPVFDDAYGRDVYDHYNINWV